MLTRITIAALALCAVATPAHASDVTVQFGLSAGTYAPTGAACTLSVPAGADGIAVLDAAVAAHCIASYRTTSFPFGTFVSCINEVCGQDTGVAEAGTFAGAYWNMYDNGTSAGYGVDGFTADAGDELAFAYQTYCFGSLCLV